MVSKEARVLRHAALLIVILAGGPAARANALAEYEAIIQSARAGAYTQALSALENWSAAEPSQRRVNSDWVEILGQAGRSADALALAKRVGILALEPYALKSAAVAARSSQDPAWAVTAYTRIAEQDPTDCDARLGLALSLADADQSGPAGVVLDALEQNCTPLTGKYVRAIAQARTYWAARRVNTRLPQDLLALGWWSEKLDPAFQASGTGKVEHATQQEQPSRQPQSSRQPPLPENYLSEATREALLLASTNGAHHLVRRWSARIAQRGPGSLTGEERAQMLSAKAAQQIRWAIATSDGPRADWRALLDAALASLQQAATLTQQPNLCASIASDTVAAFAELGDDVNTLRQVELADAAALTLLPYAEVGAADALMRANQPRAAELRLRAALARSNSTGEFDQRDLSVALFYALIDQGKVAEARNWIDARTALVPAFSNRGLAGVQVEDDGFVRFQLARSILPSPALDGRAFDASRLQMSSLLRDAPFNPDVRLSEAEWSQARGWPRAAADKAQLVLADKPDNTRALDVAARQALDRGDFAAFEAHQQGMQTMGAHPLMLQRLQTAADKQMGFVLAGEAVRGTGEASDPSSGSSDREAALSLLSPVYQNRWRLKARWRSSNAQFGNADPATQFFAVGARFYWPYFWAELEAVRRTKPESPAGLRVTGQWQLADGVSAYAALASRAEELPLRGQAAGVSATSAQLSLDWRALPQTYVGTSLNGFNASDGNRQRGASAYADQAYTLADHWRANARFDMSHATNSRIEVAYFSPRAVSSVALTGVLAHDLVVSGQTGWTHKLALSVGSVAQRGFERGASHSLLYEHEWRLGSYRTVSAAIGESRRPYDGVQSRRKTFSLRWSLAL